VGMNERSTHKREAEVDGTHTNSAACGPGSMSAGGRGYIATQPESAVTAPGRVFLAEANL
jgi:hypothetical protein